jgi:hypothetical protein
MLHEEAVAPHTLALIQKLQAVPALENFFLVGGTSLALQMGHRTSVDIDLFTSEDIDIDKLIATLQDGHIQVQVSYRAKNTLITFVEGVKVDFITHNYPLLENLIWENGIRMASKSDIAAMKVNAIAGNGTRVKDFVDIYYLLNDYSFAQIISFFKSKYRQQSDFHAIKSLTFFDDVDLADWPVLLVDKQLKWPQVMKKIQQACKTNTHGNI